VPVFVERQRAVAAATLGFVVLNFGVASGMFLALYDFDLNAFGDPGSLVGRSDVGDAWRAASIIDMVSYLALAPVVVCLHGRFSAVASERAKRSGVVLLLTFCGLAFVLVGSIGAVLMASVGPPLLEAAITEQTLARVGFEALVSAVAVGLWGILELLLFGVWLIGVAWFVRGEGRLFAAVAAVAAAGMLAYAARTGVTGRVPLDNPGPLDVVILGAVGVVVVWGIWLAARLWRIDADASRR